MIEMTNAELYQTMTAISWQISKLRKRIRQLSKDASKIETLYKVDIVVVKRIEDKIKILESSRSKLRQQYFNQRRKL